MLTAAGAHAGVLKGLPCLFGAATGMGLMMFLVPLGLGSAVSMFPLLLKGLNLAGAALLLWLSWRIATSSGGIEASRGRQPVGYVGAMLFQWINPKSWLVSASAAGTFLTSGAGPIVQAACLGSIFVLAALASGFVWLAFGATIQHVLHGRGLRIFNIAMGLLLALSIALIVR
jgi:threonine/homoserine/homoserine lactone efflux protein